MENCLRAVEGLAKVVGLIPFVMKQLFSLSCVKTLGLALSQGPSVTYKLRHLVFNLKGRGDRYVAELRKTK